MKKHDVVKIASCALLVGAVSAKAAATEILVYPNTPTGDSYTNPSGANQGQALLGSDWFYNNVRNGGGVGIDMTYARSGNGSVHLQTPTGSAKADIELLGTGTAVSGNFYAASSLRPLATLQTLAYDWYRDSSSTVASHFHPALRVLIDADGDLNTTGDRGGLVFERAYNPSVSAVPTDTWNTDVVFDKFNTSVDTKVWSFGLGRAAAADGYGVLFSEWQAGVTAGSHALGTGNAVILGYSMGVGSGWTGTFDGAVDNLTSRFGGDDFETNYNFEAAPTAVPEVSTLAASGTLGFLVAGSAWLRRRKK
jgi:hypothetical protein